MQRQRAMRHRAMREHAEAQDREPTADRGNDNREEHDDRSITLTERLRGIPYDRHVGVGNRWQIDDIGGTRVGGSLGHTQRANVEVLCLRDDDVIVVVRRPHSPGNVALVLSFAPNARPVSLPLPSGQWSVLLDSADSRWAGPGSRVARTFTVREQADVLLAPWSALFLLQDAVA